MVSHNGKDALFAGVPKAFRATRYHSLVVNPSSLPDEFDVTAEVDEVIMAMRHRPTGAVGVQFHPESILTDYGKRMIANFLQGAA